MGIEVEGKCGPVCPIGRTTRRRRRQSALLIICLALNFVGLLLVIAVTIWARSELAREAAYRSASEAARAIEEQTRKVDSGGTR